MEYSPGRSTVATMFRTIKADDNAVPVAVGAGYTTIAAVSLGALVDGDELLILARGHGTKGVVAGDISLQVFFSGGTGAIQWDDNAAPPRIEIGTTPAGLPQGIAIVARGHCVTSGTVSLTLYGVSHGSDWTIATGEGALSVFVWPEA